MKALFIVPQIGFNETELFTLKRFLERHKITCVVGSYSKGKVIGKTGKTVVAKQVLCNIDVNDYDCFIVVGGMNVSSLVEHKCVVDMIDNACSSGKLIVLLCMAPALFCSILKGKRATVFKTKNLWSVKALGSAYVDSPIVIDSNVISCRDEKDSLALAKKIVEVLKK
jgi:putative intracellular protease/amidase